MSTGDRSCATVILCLTEKGAELAIKLSQLMSGSIVFAPARLQDLYKSGDRASLKFFSQWRNTFSEVFSQHTRIVCIMATGIVVRSLGPLMSSKFNDPAVVVLDEKGRYAISLLSGHLGGANQLAKEVAGYLNGQAVITTATDVHNQPAVDLLAAQMEAHLEPVEKVKIINRLLAEGKEVNLYSPYPLSKAIMRGFCWREWPKVYQKQENLGLISISNLRQPAVIISPQKVEMDSPSECIQIKTKNLVVGIGCRKGVSYAEIQRAFTDVMDSFALDTSCVKYLATIDIKAEEDAIKCLSKELGIPILTFSKEEISTLDGTYEASEWVKEKVGVGGVCEPAARLAAKQGKTIVPKQKIGAVTISVAMEKSWWWDWDLETENF